LWILGFWQAIVAWTRWSRLVAKAHYSKSLLKSATNTFCIWSSFTSQARHRKLQALNLERTRLKAAAMKLLGAHLVLCRQERVLEKRACIFHMRSLYMDSVRIWKIAAFELRVSSRLNTFASRSCFCAWYSWSRSRADSRRRAEAAHARLQKRCGVRKWMSWQSNRSKRRDREVMALSFRASTKLRAVMIWWCISHQMALCERKSLAVRAAWCQWCKHASYCRAMRSHLRTMLELTASTNIRRLKLSNFRKWNSVVVWTVAHLNATAQLISELRRARESQAFLRRQSTGLNEEELQMVQCIFIEWKTHAIGQCKLQQKIVQECCSRNHVMLLLVMDHWVDGSLAASRSENLRRRRHVRFSLDAKGMQRRRSGSLLHRGTSQLAVSGGLGQWAQKTISWEASAALSEPLEASPSSQKGETEVAAAPSLTLGPHLSHMSEESCSFVMQMPLAIASGQYGTRSSLAETTYSTPQKSSQTQLAIDADSPATLVKRCRELVEEDSHDRRCDADARVGNSATPCSTKGAQTKTPDLLRFFKVRGCAGA